LIVIASEILVIVAKVENKDLRVNIKASDYEALTLILNLILTNISNLPVRLTTYSSAHSEMISKIEVQEKQLRIILEQYEIARAEILKEE